MILAILSIPAIGDFSSTAFQYLEQEGTVIYTAKDGRANKNFPALEWIVAMCSHIPNRGEQMVRCYGYYSNVSRGKRKTKHVNRIL